MKMNEHTAMFLRRVEIKTGLILNYITRVGSQNPSIDILKLKYPAKQVKYLANTVIKSTTDIAKELGFEIEWE